MEIDTDKIADAVLARSFGAASAAAMPMRPKLLPASNPLNARPRRPPPDERLPE
jgi:hypothetical protein